jgi:hypothetical protein
MRVQTLKIVSLRPTGQGHIVTWRNFAKPTKRRAKAEALARFARTDDADALVRVRA